VTATPVLSRHPETTGRRPASRRLPGLPVPGRRNVDVDDSGMTLVEVLIASTLLIVLLTAVMVTMNLLETVSSSVNSQYQEYDQALPALDPLQNLLRAEVEPGPPAQNGVPQPGFAVVGNFSLTFYSNIGTAYGNVTSAGTTGGPAKIVAEELDANGNPVTSSTSCSTTNLCSFQVQEYLPTINAGVSTCPGVSPSGTACQYSTYKLLANVLGVVNDPSQQSGGAPTEPIFTYNVFDPNAGVGSNLTAAQVQTLTCGVPTGSQSVVQACQQDFIQSVGVDLMLARKGAGTNGTVDEQTIVYRYAESPGASSYPYQYTSTEG
jgi:type II secretory pathway component PulJ